MIAVHPGFERAFLQDSPRLAATRTAVTPTAAARAMQKAV